MRLRTLLVAAIALCALIVPNAASAATSRYVGQPPQHTDYLVCVGGHVYTDFTDPDGDDTKLVAAMAVERYGEWTYHPMTNTGQTVHGVFFWIKLSDHGINPADVDWYAFAATDEDGDWWGWRYADRNCTLE